jgi:hypothetical protein
VGLPTVLEASSIDEIVQARKILPFSQDNLEKNNLMIGPEHVVLTGHLDLADQKPFPVKEPKKDISIYRSLFEYPNLRSIRVCCVLLVLFLLVIEGLAYLAYRSVYEVVLLTIWWRSVERA